MVPSQHSKGIHLCWVPGCWKGRRGHTASPVAMGLVQEHFAAWELSILGSLPSSLSLVDQPPLAFSSSIVFLTNKNVNWRAFSLFKHSKKVYLAGTTALVCKLIFFPFLPFYCAVLIQAPWRRDREFCISESVQQILKSYLWIFYNTHTDLKSLLKKTPDTLQQY